VSIPTLPNMPSLPNININTPPDSTILTDSTDSTKNINPSMNSNESKLQVELSPVEPVEPESNVTVKD